MLVWNDEGRGGCFVWGSKFGDVLVRQGIGSIPAGCCSCVWDGYEEEEEEDNEENHDSHIEREKERKRHERGMPNQKRISSDK